MVVAPNRESDSVAAYRGPVGSAKDIHLCRRRPCCADGLLKCGLTRKICHACLPVYCRQTTGRLAGRKGGPPPAARRVPGDHGSGRRPAQTIPMTGPFRTPSPTREAPLPVVVADTGDTAYSTSSPGEIAPGFRRRNLATLHYGHSIMAVRQPPEVSGNGIAGLVHSPPRPHRIQPPGRPQRHRPTGLPRRRARHEEPGDNRPRRPVRGHRLLPGRQEGRDQADRRL